jgi:biopolymer transport protein TolR
MSLNAGSRNGQSVEMNVTPLIDVLLVLIIIFMVVLPRHSAGERADIPQPPASDANTPVPENDIVVQLLSSGEGNRPRIKINQSEISWDELLPRMRAILLTRVQRVAFLKSDPDVEFGYVAQIVDRTRAAGADRVGLMPADNNLRR